MSSRWSRSQTAQAVDRDRGLGACRSRSRRAFSREVTDGIRSVPCVVVTAELAKDWQPLTPPPPPLTATSARRRISTSGIRPTPDDAARAYRVRPTSGQRSATSRRRSSPRPVTLLYCRQVPRQTVVQRADNDPHRHVTRLASETSVPIHPGRGGAGARRALRHEQVVVDAHEERGHVAASRTALNAASARKKCVRVGVR